MTKDKALNSMDTSKDTLQEVNYDFVQQWRTKIGYHHLELVNLDPGPHGRIVWTYTPPALLQRLLEQCKTVADAPASVKIELVEDGNGISISSEGILQVQIPPGPLPRFFINKKHSILLINWNIDPDDDDRYITRLEFVQAIERALTSLEENHPTRR